MPLPPSIPLVDRSWRDYALLLALACCWSSTYPLTKIGLATIPPITFISARSLIAALFLLVILRLRGLRADFSGAGKLGKLFKRAAAAGAKHVALVGGAEWDRGLIRLRDMNTGAERDVPRADVPAALAGG